MVEQLSVIGQIIKKKYKYRQNIWQPFVNFKKTYDSVHRQSLYYIMEKLRFSKKLMTLVQMCMENTQYRIRIEQTISEAFKVRTSLKQGDFLSHTLFNVANEKVIREMQMVVI